jgi:GNAT superfamily N-acetyltransferase
MRGPSANRLPNDIILRHPQPGDMGWIVSANAESYARDQEFDQRFEATCAEVVAAYLRSHDPARERWWIAERNGARVGSVGAMRASDEVAKLRVLYVDPSARGCGLGRRLTRECIRFCRDAGYTTLTLWTVDILTAARRIYETEGFRLVHAEPYDGLGPLVSSETWNLTLADWRDDDD